MAKKTKFAALVFHMPLDSHISLQINTFFLKFSGVVMNCSHEMIMVMLPDIPENWQNVADLSRNVEGVVIKRGSMAADGETVAVAEVGSDETLTLPELAEYLGINYFTARNWVVDQGRIPFKRMSGARQGHITVAKKDAVSLKTVQAKKEQRRRGRKTNEVAII